MSTNVTAFIQRWVTDTAEQLKTGAQQLQKGQWGFARMDEKAVLCDLEGRYHELMVPGIAYPYMAQLILSHYPVADYASLPSTDLAGSIRLVENELAVYIYTGSDWIKQPFESLYSDFVGVGAITVTVSPSGGGVPVAGVSHKSTDGYRHIPATKAALTPERVIINGRTLKTVNIRGITWLAEDLIYGTNAWTSNAQKTYSTMKEADTLHPDWAVPTLDQWKAINTQSPNPRTLAEKLAILRKYPIPIGTDTLYGNNEHRNPADVGSPYADTYDGPWGGGPTGPSGLNIGLAAGGNGVQYWSNTLVSGKMRDDGNVQYPTIAYPGWYKDQGTSWVSWQFCRRLYGIMYFGPGWCPRTSDWYYKDGVYSGAEFGQPPPEASAYPPDVARIRLVRRRYDPGTNAGKCLVAKTDLAGSEKWDFPNMDMTSQGSTSKKLTATEYNDLTDKGDSALHCHAYDRGYSVDVMTSTDFTFIHDMEQKPSVELIDTAGNQIWVEVEYPDDNTVHVMCNQEFTGTMRLV